MSDGFDFIDGVRARAKASHGSLCTIFAPSQTLRIRRRSLSSTAGPEPQDVSFRERSPRHRPRRVAAPTLFPQRRSHYGYEHQLYRHRHTRPGGRGARRERAFPHSVNGEEGDALSLEGDRRRPAPVCASSSTTICRSVSPSPSRSRRTAWCAPIAASPCCSRCPTSCASARTGRRSSAGAERPQPCRCSSAAITPRSSASPRSLPMAG